MNTLTGIAASPGIGIGPVHIVDPEEIEVPDGAIPKEKVAAEQERFRAAIEAGLREVKTLREKIALETGEEHAGILDTQIAILEDPDAIATLPGPIPTAAGVASPRTRPISSPSAANTWSAWPTGVAIRSARRTRSSGGSWRGWRRRRWRRCGAGGTRECGRTS